MSLGLNSSSAAQSIRCYAKMIGLRVWGVRFWGLGVQDFRRLRASGLGCGGGGYTDRTIPIFFQKKPTLCLASKNCQVLAVT